MCRRRRPTGGEPPRGRLAPRAAVGQNSVPNSVRWGGLPLPPKKDIRPITLLKSRTAELVREVSEEGRPITITQHGEAKVVVMDVETYDRWRAAMTLLKALAQAEADVGAGRKVKQAEAFRRARKAIERPAADD